MATVVPCHTIIRATFPGLAPNASRTPISLVRCETMYDVVPSTPTVPSASVITAVIVKAGALTNRRAAKTDSFQVPSSQVGMNPSSANALRETYDQTIRRVQQLVHCLHRSL